MFYHDVTSVKPGGRIQMWRKGQLLPGVLIALFGDARVSQARVAERRPWLKSDDTTLLMCGYCFKKTPHPLVCILLQGLNQPIIECNGCLCDDPPMYSHEQEQEEP